MKHPLERHVAVRGSATVAAALGAVAIGAFAIGALAIGRLAIRRITVGGAKFKSLQINKLTVTRLRVSALSVSDSLTLPQSPRSKIRSQTEAASQARTTAFFQSARFDFSASCHGGMRRGTTQPPRGSPPFRASADQHCVLATYARSASDAP
jgi:hypothetical protein